MEDQQLVSPLRQCSSTPAGFGQGLSEYQCDNNAAHPTFSRPVSRWFLPVPSIEISIEGTALLWRYCIIKNAAGRAEKAFTKRLPGMFSTFLQSMEEVCSCKRGLLLGKCSLNDCTLLYFSEIKWFRIHFEATMCFVRYRKTPELNRLLALPHIWRL